MGKNGFLILEDVEYAKCRNYVSRESTGIKLKSSIWIYKEKK